MKIAFLLAVAFSMQLPSYQIQTADSVADFNYKVESMASLATVIWNNVINLKGRQANSGTDVAGWISGDIENRFQGTSLSPLKATLSSTAQSLGGAYLDDRGLLLGSLNGQLGAVYGPIGEDTVFNTVRLTPRQRAGRAVADFVLPRLKAFDALSRVPGVASVGIVVAYGRRNFVESASQILDTKGESVTVVVPTSTLLRFLEKTMSADELLEKAETWLCGDFAKCEKVRPALP